MGRACVDRDHRNGAVLPLMWAGVLRYLRLTGHDWLIGCVSVPMDGDGANVRAVRDVLRARHAGPAIARPHRPVPGLETLPAPDKAALPPTAARNTCASAPRSAAIPRTTPTSRWRISSRCSACTRPTSATWTD